MASLDRYIIEYKCFSDGGGEFQFDIDDTLFEEFGEQNVIGGEATVKVEMDKSASMLVLCVTIIGEVRVECDRCLDELKLPVDYKGRLTVKFSETESDDLEDDVMCVSAEGEINLGQYLYESIMINLPYQRVHNSIEECNAEMMKYFKIVTQEEFDAFAEKHKTLEQNPDFAKLKEFKNNL